MTKKINFTQYPDFIRPNREMVKKAKASLGIPQRVKLPRCPAKRSSVVAHHPEHKDDTHLCDECRCGFRAGYGTSHLGVGYCIVHEKVRRYAGHKERVVEAHKIAIRQGYPDKAYAYAHSDPDGYVQKIRKSAEDAGGMTDLREDIVALRAEVQRVLDSYDSGDFKVRVKKTTKLYDEKTGKLISSRDKFVYVDADDEEKSKALVSAVRAVSRLSVDNLKLTEDDVVTYDQVKIWAAGTISLMEQMAPSPEFRNEFIEKFAILLDNVRTGR